MHGIYKIWFVGSARCYIGSAVDLKDRKRCHLKNLKSGKHHNNYLLNAFNKYGEKAFNFEIVEVILNKLDLIPREQAWIDAFDFDMLYNLQPNARSPLGFKHSEKSKQNMSNAHKGKKLTPEHAKKIAKVNIGRKHTEKAKQNMSKAQKGLKMSEEAKTNMSLCRKGKKQSKKTVTKRKNTMKKLYGGAVNKRKVNQICLKTGAILNTFDSIALASQKVFTLSSSNITTVCKGRRKSAGGFSWEYSD